MQGLFGNIQKWDRYGVPYMGSKSQIAPWVLANLPDARNFYDLFAGGCAVSHAALVSGRYENVYANDASPFGVTLFRDAISGKYHDECRWISRAEFNHLKEYDPYVRLCWSYGNASTSYMYAEELEPFKMRLHNMFFAKTPHDMRLAWRAFVREFARLADDVSRLREYVESLFKDCGLDTPRRVDGTPDVEKAMKMLNSHLAKEIRDYMRSALSASGKSQQDVSTYLGTQMARHYFASSQWALPTAEHYAKMQEIIPGLTRPWAELRESLQRLQRLERLESLESLESLQSLQSLESLQRLESLESLQSLERLSIKIGDYRKVEVLPDSVVYCDPPYRNTQQYSDTSDFSHTEFDEWLRTVDFPVYISEYTMPDDFQRIALIGKSALMSGKGTTMKMPEGIWLHKRWI